MTPAVFGAVICAIGVGMGAFGAHAISKILSSEAQAWWSTATEYLWYHGLGCLALGRLPYDPRIQKAVASALLPGILLFSGSLYLYAFTGWRPFGMITPIGGTLLLIGWVWLAFVLKRNQTVTKM